MTVHLRNDGDGVSPLNGTQVDNSILQRLLPCQVGRLLHTSESGEKVPARTQLRSITPAGACYRQHGFLPTQEQAASAEDKLGAFLVELSCCLSEVVELCVYQLLVPRFHVSVLGDYVCGRSLDGGLGKS